MPTLIPGSGRAGTLAAMISVKSVVRGVAFAAVLVALGTGMGLPGRTATSHAEAGSPVQMVAERNQAGGQFIYVVFHALDRDGFCNPPPGAVSLHPALGIPINFVIEAGDGIVLETSSGSTAPGRSATAVPTFSTALNAASAAPVRAFAPLVAGVTDECQAWVKVSQSIPGPLRVLVTVEADDGGQLGFVADLARPAAHEITLTFRWSLVTWQGADSTPPGDALKGPAGGTDISGDVTALYGWDAGAQTWLAYFPSGSGVPGANDLASLERGSAYWVAIKGPGPVAWAVADAAG